ncbi:MAG: hypothetical protein RL215_1642 [Planctomycetota bacterium]
MLVRAWLFFSDGISVQSEVRSMEPLDFRRLARHGRDLPYRTGLSIDALREVPVTYRERSIRKRSGSSRILSIPNQRLMAVQRLLLRKVLQLLPMHPAAKGFRRRQGIFEHASIHSGKPWVVLMDIKDFFPSTAASRIRSKLEQFAWPAPLIDQLVRLVCHPQSGGLPQGAPTSPAISNIVNWELDTRLAGFARQNGLCYSRYADDLAFSPLSPTDPPPPWSSVRFAKTVLAEYGYELNERKIRVLRAGHQQNVTGLVVNSSCNLPRSIRRRIRAAEHRLQHDKPLTAVDHSGEETPMTAEQLQGWIGYSAMIARKTEQLRESSTSSQGH